MQSKRGKTVTESFTLPEGERLILCDLSIKYPHIRPPLKKSEAIRVGLNVFAGLSEKKVERILTELGRLIVGRPSTEEETVKGPLRLSDKQWKGARLLVKAKTDAGHGTRDIIDGILFAFSNTPAVKKLPAEYPDYDACIRQLEQWKATGTWLKVCSSLTELVKGAEHDRLRAILWTTLIG